MSSKNNLNNKKYNDYVKNRAGNRNISCYINPRHKKMIPFVPEKTTTLMKFNIGLWKKKFIYKKGLNYSKLMLTNIGRYSISSPAMSKLIPTLISDYMTLNKKITKKYNDLIITETCGGVGGFTLSLAPIFKKINVVEINPVHSEVIENNLDVYGYNKDNNVNIITDDYLNVMLKLKQDVIITDLPWGGPDYKENALLRLGFNNIDIACVINKLIKYNKFRMYILLVPYNFNIKLFINMVNSDNIIINKSGKHYIISIMN